MARVLFILVLLSSIPVRLVAAEPLWNMRELEKAPKIKWGEVSNQVQSLYYAGEPFQGKPTRIFAWLGKPKGNGPFPGIVLVHGGGGKAFSDWAEHWAERGYVSIAMDTAGNGPNGRLPDGGPDQTDETKFRDFTPAEIKDMWTYHAVADAILAHSLLLNIPEVDKNRTGLTGNSWGGYLTCIIAAVDRRFKAAAPVYGCGFLDEDSYWQPRLVGMPAERRERWVRYFDPSSYVAQIRCPVLFLNDTTDWAYPMDSYKKTYQLAKCRHWVSVQLGLPHHQMWNYPDVLAFEDWALKGGAALPKISALKIRDGEARATIHPTSPIVRAELCYTSSTGPWKDRKWKTEPAELKGNKISAPIPAKWPLAFYISVTDERDLKVSTQYEELREEVLPAVSR